MRLYLHVGIEKTGTSSLQQFLRLNRELLKSAGFFFSEVAGVENHISLAAAAQDLAKRDDLRARLRLDSTASIIAYRTSLSEQLQREAERSGCRTFIMSSEHCSSRLTTVEEIATLARILLPACADIRIVVYLRRQDDFLCSTYSTDVKSGFTGEMFVPSTELKRLRYDYAALLARWAAVFGRQNIICRIYDRTRLPGGNITNDFLRVVRVPPTPDYRAPANINESLDVRCLEFLRLFNTGALRDQEVGRLRRTMVSVLCELSQGPAATLPEESLIEFMASFRDSNAAVAQEYFRFQSEIGDPLFGKAKSRATRALMQPIDRETALALVKRVRQLQLHKKAPSGMSQEVQAALVDLGCAYVLAELGAPDEVQKLLSQHLGRKIHYSEFWICAARLSARIRSWPDAIVCFREAAALTPAYEPELISALIRAERSSEALELIQRAVSNFSATCPLLFACYSAGISLSLSDDELATIRSRLLIAAEVNSKEGYWLARLYRRDGKFDEAIKCLNSEVSIGAEENRDLIKERASIAIESGRWGEYSAEILKGRLVANTGSELGRRVALADQLLLSFGGSLEGAAAAGTFSHVRTPESIFERTVESCQITDRTTRPDTLVMIASSLAPGGAERVIATLARALSKNRTFNKVILYLCDLDPASKKDFYLPVTALQLSEITLLDRSRTPEAPLNFLPGEHGKIAQSILDHLRRDRPAAVYVALEPLTVFAGLAAVIAGVPRIVLHTHNMPPTELHPRAPFPERLRDCYRILLKQPHITLITCARIAATRYVNWLGKDFEPRIRHIYNGLDFTELRPLCRMNRSSLRERLGLPTDRLVIGTAMNFRPEKQPILWVDAAEKIHQLRPDTHFVMFGDGTLWQMTRDYIAAKGLENSFSMPGLMSDIYHRLPALDLFMLSSRSEALPNVLIEAQAAGIPVVSSDVGGAAETFCPGKTGLLASEISASALAEAAVAALNDDYWYATASRTAPEFVCGRFTIEKMCTTFSQVLKPPLTSRSSDSKLSDAQLAV